jgi:hypothetical protein
VPLVDKRTISNKMIYGAILIDAYSGAFLEASCAQKPFPYSYLDLPQSQARNMFIKKIQEQEGILEKDIQAEIPTLIWEPGLSVNPYFPVWETSTTIRGITTVRHLDFDNNISPLFHKKAANK